MNTYVPLDVGRLIIGENVYGFFIKTIARPGVMAEILRTAARFGLTIVHITNSLPAKIGSPASFMVFYDFMNVKATPEEVKKAIEKSVEAVEVEIIRPKLKGLIADLMHFPLLFLNERAIILRTTVLKGWLIRIRERFGSGGEAFLFYEGFEMGSAVYDDYMRLGFKGKELWDVLSITLFSTGIARDMAINLATPVTIEVWENIECSMASSKGKCFSQWLRGVLSGFASRYFKKTVCANEVKCLAKGDSSCIFEISL